MKILHLISTPYWSGPLDNVSLLALAQREAGHDVEVAIDRTRSDAPTEELAEPRLRALGLLAEVPLRLSVKSPPWELWGDLRALARLPVDVVHAHMSHDHLLARWGLPRRAVLVRSVHAPRSLRPGLPRAHGFTLPFAGALERFPRRPAWVLPALLGPEFRPAEDKQALRSELGLSGEPLVGMVSTFKASRRHALALRAFGRLAGVRPGAKLLLVGDGGLQPELERTVRELRLQEKVRFGGYLQGTAYLRHLQALDEVWILGLGNDWSARAALQARACGVRVVAVREGALPEWADALCEPEAEALVQVSVAQTRRPRVLPSNESIAADVLELYAQCQARVRGQGR